MYILDLEGSIANGKHNMTQWGRQKNYLGIILFNCDLGHIHVIQFIFVAISHTMLKQYLITLFRFYCMLKIFQWLRNFDLIE